METTEEVNLIFICKNKQIKLELPNGTDNMYRIWEHSLGHGFKSLSKCFDFMKETYGEFKLEKLVLNKTIKIEV